MKERHLALVPDDPAAAEVLAARAARLRAQTVEEAGGITVELAEFVAGDARYVMPLERLQGAIALKSVCPVPFAERHVIGVLRFGGQIVPAFSFASLVHASGWRQDPAVLVVVDVSPFDAESAQWVAFDCEEIPRVRALPRGLIERALVEATGPLTPLVHEGTRLIFVDPARLVAKGEGRDGA